MRKYVVVLSKPKGHPEREQYVELTSEEVAARQAESLENARKAAKESVLQAERDEMATLREKLLDAQAAMEDVDPSMRDRFRELKAKHGA